MINACLPLSRKYSPAEFKQEKNEGKGIYNLFNGIVGRTHGTAGVGGQKLQRGGIRSGGSHDNGVFHGIRIRQSLDNLSDSGSLLADSNIDAIQLLFLISSIVEPLLVDDCIDGDGGLTAKR